MILSVSYNFPFIWANYLRQYTLAEFRSELALIPTSSQYNPMCESDWTFIFHSLEFEVLSVDFFLCKMLKGIILLILSQTLT